MYIFLLFIINTNAQDSAQYLESVMKSLANTHSRSQISQRKMDNFRSSKLPVGLPTFSPTKEELAQLYGVALRKGDSVKIHTEDHGPSIDAALYEIDDDEHDHEDKSPKSEDSYYYYYYPLKAFVDELTSDKKSHHGDDESHDHNIHILDKKASTDKKPKALEPLFMAISGFIGMTIMFVLSALILPKIGVLKPRDGKDSPEMTSIAKVIFQAIEGYDCSDRLTCEFGKTARAFNLHNNRFVKLIRRLGPVSLSKQLYDMNKYSNKKYKCAVIQCKMKTKSKILQQKKKSKL